MTPNTTDRRRASPMIRLIGAVPAEQHDGLEMLATPD
jgi:hypothetical protein